MVSMSESTGSSMSTSEDSEVDVDGGVNLGAPEVKIESVEEAGGEGEGEKEPITPLPTSVSAEKKLPKVILKLGPRPGSEV